MVKISERHDSLTKAQLYFLEENSKKEILECFHAIDNYSVLKNIKQLSTELSKNQIYLWAVNNLLANKTSNRLGLIVQINNEIDTNILIRSIKKIINNNKILSLKIENIENQPYATENADIAIEIIDYSYLPTNLAKEKAKRKIIDLISKKENIPFFNVKIIKIFEAYTQVQIIADHIIWDGISHSIFVEQLVNNYKHLKENIYSKKFDAQYSDYVSDSNKKLVVSKTRLEKFWLDYLNNYELTELCCDNFRDSNYSTNGSITTFDFTNDDYQKINQSTKNHKVTLFNILFSGLFIFIHRMTNNNNPVIGTPVNCRDNPEWQNLLGYFVNLLPVTVDINGVDTFSDIIKKTHLAVDKACRHKELPFGDIIKVVNPPRIINKPALVQIEITLEYKNSQHARDKGLNIAYETIHDGKARFDISFIFQVEDKKLSLLVEYNNSLYKKETINNFVTYFRNLLINSIDKPTEPIKRLHMISKQEYSKILKRGRGEKSHVNNNDLFLMLKERAEAHGDSIAIKYKKTFLTYKELYQNAIFKANLIKACGIKYKDRVVIHLDRSIELLETIYAVLALGATFVPTDPKQPIQRIEQIVEDVNPKLIITDTNLDQLNNNYKILKQASLTREKNTECPLFEYQVPARNHPAYILYTSGSTGRPKGVMVGHYSVANFIEAINKLYNISSQDKILGFAEITFDVAIFEVFSALYAGATLIFASSEVRKHPIPMLIDLIANENITVAEIPPALLKLFPPKSVPNLKVISLGGEAFSPALVNEWAGGRSLYNGYGPTESTVAAIVELLASNENGRVPIGLPIKNTNVLVLDKYNNVCSACMPGELHIAGAGLALGYWNDKSKTQAAFCKNLVNQKGFRRLYKTGDLVRWRSDGKLEYLGRIDKQIKIRGYRIELEEIECVIEKYLGISKAIVIPFEEQNKETYLVAFVIGSHKTKPELLDMRNSLSEVLPNYMIPAKLYTLEKIPYTSTGKINKNKLLEHAKENSFVKEDAVYENSIIAKTAQVVFSDILNVNSADGNDDFFSLGGSSLQAIVAISRLRDAFGVNISIADLFKSSKLSDLSQKLIELGAVEDHNKKIRPINEIINDEQPIVYKNVKNCKLLDKQNKLWSRYLNDINDNSSNYSLFLNISGEVKIAVLKEAIAILLVTHTALQIKIKCYKSTPYMVVDNQYKGKLHKYFVKTSKELANHFEKISAESIDLYDSPLVQFHLFKINRNNSILVIKMHHIIVDGWSSKIIINDLFTIYKAIIDNKDPFKSVQKEQLSFIDYAANQHLWFEKNASTVKKIYEDKKSEILLSKNALSDLPMVTHQFSLEKDELSNLNEITSELNTTKYIVLLTALCLSIKTCTHQKSFIVGSPVASRVMSKIENSVGYFANLSLIIVDLTNAHNFKATYEAVKQAVIKSLSTTFTSAEYIKRVLKDNEFSYQILFALQDTPGFNNNFGELKLSKYFPAGNKKVLGISKFYSPLGSSVQISLAMEHIENQLHGLWELNSSMEPSLQKNIKSKFLYFLSMFKK